jgi:hydroxymethylbilane synthase
VTQTATLRLGTRQSALAMAQSQTIADQLEAALGLTVTLVPVVTAGDRSSAALDQIGGTGVFVSALRDALLAGEVDLAVHSLKDLPTAPAAGILLAAVPSREDPRDALVCPAGLGLGELAPGAKVGTGSPRRAAQLHALGMGLDVVPIRGNVDTRIKKALDGEVDAVVLARAGLARLDRLDAVTEILDPLQMLPAPGQGALAIECCDDAVAARLAVLTDEASRLAVLAERALLAALEAGCTAPVGALADVGESDTGETEIYLRAVVAAVDGSDAIRLSASGPGTDPLGLGRRLATDLLAAGAATMMGKL